LLCDISVATEDAVLGHPAVKMGGVSSMPLWQIALPLKVARYLLLEDKAYTGVIQLGSETGTFGLLMWLAGVALGWRAWRYSDAAARDQARPAMLALAVTIFPFNTHLAFYSTFWGGVTLLLAALFAGSLLARDAEAAAIAAPKTA